FNNQFFPQDFNQSVSDITSSIALTHQTKRINQRLVFERLDAPDPEDDPLFADTHIQSASIPRYDFTLFQMPLWSPAVPVISSTTVFKPNHLGPLQLSVNGNAGETYTRATERTQANATGSASVSQNITLNRQWSFTPSITPGLHWQDQFTSTSSVNDFR